MELGRTSTSRTGLGLLALVVAAAALGWMLLAPKPEMPEIPVPAPKAQATEQEMEEAWENLVDAIRRRDQSKALRIAEWLDKQQTLKTYSIPVTTLEIVKTWCALKDDLGGICEEANSEAK